MHDTRFYIVAKTRQSAFEGGFCFAVYDRVSQNLIRPIPRQTNEAVMKAQERTPFWHGDRYEALQVGEAVSVVSPVVTESVEQRCQSPHDNEDVQCDDVASTGGEHEAGRVISDAAAIFRSLMSGSSEVRGRTVAQRIDARWSRRGVHAGAAARRASLVVGSGDTPSLLCARGVLQDLRVSADADGRKRVHACVNDYHERIDRVPVTCQDIIAALHGGEGEEEMAPTGSLALQQQYGNKAGILILGLARRQYQHAALPMMVVGFIPDPSPKEFIPLPLLRGMFCLTDEGVDIKHAEDHFVAFLKEAAFGLKERRPREVRRAVWRLQHQRADDVGDHINGGCAAHPCADTVDSHIDEDGAGHGRADNVDYHISEGCAVVWCSAARCNLRPPDQNCGVYVVAPRSVGTAKRSGQYSYVDFIDSEAVKDVRQAYKEAKREQAETERRALSSGDIVRRLRAAIAEMRGDASGGVWSSTFAPLQVETVPSQKVLNSTHKFFIDQLEGGIPDCTYKELRLEYLLYLSGRNLQHMVERHNCEPNHVDCAAHLIHKASRKVAKYLRSRGMAISDEVHDAGGDAGCAHTLGNWGDRLRTMWRTLQDIQLTQRRMKALEYSLPDDLHAVLKTSNSAVTRFMFPASQEPPPAQPVDIREIEAVVELNSPPIVITPCRRGLGEYLKALQRGKDGFHATLQGLRDFERFVFRRAKDHHFDLAAEHSSTPKRETETLVRQLGACLDTYMSESLRFRTEAGDEWVMHREQQHSREVLVCHSICCMIFALCKSLYSAVMFHSGGPLRFGIGVTREKLKALLLPSGHVQAALLNVHKYIQENTTDEPLFNLITQKPTSDFGRILCCKDQELCSVLACEIKNRKLRLSAYNRETDRRRKLAEDLRQQISKAHDERARCQRELDSSCSASQIRTLEREVSDCDCSLRNLRKRLYAAEQPVETIMEPLPHLEDDMQQVVFFLHMPAPLSELARATFVAEASFLPRAKKGTKLHHTEGHELMKCAAQQGGSPWSDYYAPKQKYQYCDNATELTPKGDISLAIEFFERLPQRLHGVQWFPPMSWSLLWCQRCEGFPPNPFCISLRFLCEHVFVEQIVDDEREKRKSTDLVSWSLPLLFVSGDVDTQRQRETRAIASQDRCPDWLSPGGYVAFCTLRAFEITQLRKFLSCLQSGLLPLTDPNVHQLFRQALYQFGTEHVGDKRGQGDILYTRRVLIECYHSGLNLFRFAYTVIGRLVDEFKEKPRDHFTMGILTELAQVFVEWYEPFIGILDIIAETTCAWAEGRRNRLGVDEGEADLVLISFYLMYCISASLSLPAANLTNERLQRYLTSLILLRTVLPEDLTSAFISDAKHRWCFLDMRARVRSQLSETVHTVIDRLDRDGAVHPIINGAARRAGMSIGTMHSVGRELEWKRLDSRKTNVVYVAIDGATVYSVNVMCGDFLINGLPPGRLPQAVLQDELYRRTFGEADFRMVRVSDRLFRTARKLGSCSYEFELAGHRFACRETFQLEGGSKMTLELVDTCFLEQQLSAPLSRHLVERYTHWLCRDLGLIFFRSHMDTRACATSGFLFNQVHFILNQGRDGSESCDAPESESNDAAQCQGLEDRHHRGEQLALVQCCLPVPEDFRNAEVVFRGVELPQDITRHARRVLFLNAVVQRCEISTQLCIVTEQDVAARGLLNVLNKFEAEKYILLHSNLQWSPQPSSDADNAELKIDIVELFRFGLFFDMDPQTGRLLSREYKGYMLSQEQVLPGNQLAGFYSYLILQPIPDDDLTSTVADEHPPSGPLRILMWDSYIEDRYGSGEEETYALRPHTSSSEWTGRDVLCYNVGVAGACIEAHSIEGRLHLAGIYTLTRSPLPDCAMGFCGYGIAMRLVRESFGTRPLVSLHSKTKMHKLLNLHDLVTAALRRKAPASVSHGLLSGLNCLLAHFCASAWQLGFCYFPEAFSSQSEIRATRAIRDLLRESFSDVDSIMTRNLSCNHEQLNQQFQLATQGDGLTREEERDLLRCHARQVHVPKTLQDETLDLDHHGMCRCPVDGNFVTHVEERLSSLVTEAIGKTPANELKSDAVMKDIDRLIETMTDAFGHSEHFKSKIGEDITSELRESHHKFQETRDHILRDVGALAQVLDSTKSEAAAKLRECVRYILAMLSKFPDDSDFSKAPGVRPSDRCEAWVFRLLRDVHEQKVCAVLCATSEDPQRIENCVNMFCRMLIDDQAIRRVNPFLRPDLRAAIRGAILVFLELRVLMDKLDRLLALVRKGTDGESHQHTLAIVSELRCCRTWRSQLHPSWLIFEVTNKIQIRPRQYEVAMQLIRREGIVSQLNMGEGKTRVIMPMLVLYWTRDQFLSKREINRELMRVTVLSPLLDELRDAMHQALTVGPLACKIFELPFNRDVDLSTIENVSKLFHTLESCKASGGVLLVTPEQRLSLLLKYYEMSLASGSSDSTRRLLQLLERVVKFKAVDLLDEADEILRHKFQLVYAVGDLQSLDKGPERWTVMSGLLRVLQESEAIREKLRGNPEAVSLVERDAVHEFRRVRFISCSKAWSEDFRAELAEALLDEFLTPRFLPYDFQGAEVLMHDEQAAKRFRRLVLKKEADVERGEDGEWFSGLNERNRTLILALRGCLAYEVMYHCLERISRRHFGFNPGSQKESAVPFVAADTPSERAEFSHVDVSICYTLLSFYWEGLSRQQLRRAFAHLTEDGRNASSREYSRWFALSKHAMGALGSTLDSVNKIDLTDEAQFESLYRFYSANYETANYFCSRCVFPTETRQYSQNISANPWDLSVDADGFSGTKDGKHLFPSPIKQETLPSLQYTDALMLAILSKNRRYVCPAEPPRTWKQVLDSALVRSGCGGAGLRHDAFIDAGGYMAGASNSDVASYIVDLISSCPHAAGQARHQGVIYFDVGNRGWTIMDRRKVRTLHSKSPLDAWQCAAFFDESRTRGADLRLRRDASACVTIGPNMTKDKLMQAVGRMRKLSEGQTVEFFGSPEVTRSIRELLEARDDDSDSSGGDVQRTCPTSSFSSMYMLFWVVMNTVRSIEAALPCWAKQGGIYCAVQGDPRLAPQEETNSLHASYGQALTSQRIAKLMKSSLEELTAKTESRLAGLIGGDASATAAGRGPADAGIERYRTSQPYASLRNKIKEKLDACGGRRKMIVNVLDEELERELQKEMEREYERELPPHADPSSEHIWQYPKTFTHEAFGELLHDVGLLFPVEAVLLETAAFANPDAREALRQIWVPMNAASTEIPQSDGDGAAQILCTVNFRTSLLKQQQQFSCFDPESCSFRDATGGACTGMDQYLRPSLDFLLYFHQQQLVLLVSQYEAHHILKLFYQRAPQTGSYEPDLQRTGQPQVPEEHARTDSAEARADPEPKQRKSRRAPKHVVSFLNYSFIVSSGAQSTAADAVPSGEGSADSPISTESVVLQEDIPLALHSELGADVQLSEALIAKLQLLNGDCMFPSAARRDRVRRMLKLSPDDPGRWLGIRLAKQLVGMRGRTAEFIGSDLQGMILRAGG